MHKLSGCLHQLCWSVPRRSICLSITNFNKDLYGILGVKSSATHGEIKGAYYKLSMRYHPDKNEGCDSSAEQFRQVCNAYEVLGNNKLRKMYDRGVLHQAPQSSSDFKAYEYPKPRQQQRRGFDEPPNPEMKERFYSAYARRTVSHKTSPSSGGGNMYDFDEWTRQHYSTSFKNNREGMRIKDVRTQHRILTQKSNNSLIAATCVTVFLWLAVQTYLNDFDQTHPSRMTYVKQESSEPRKT